MELHEKYGVCGVLLLEGVETEIYTDPTTGNLLYLDELAGRDMMIGGISEATARQNMSARAISDKLAKGAYGPGVIGVVYCKDRVIVLTSETTCEIRPFNKLKVPADTHYAIDLNIDAEE